LPRTRQPLQGAVRHGHQPSSAVVFRCRGHRLEPLTYTGTRGLLSTPLTTNETPGTIDASRLASRGRYPRSVLVCPAMINDKPLWSAAITSWCCISPVTYTSQPSPRALAASAAPDPGHTPTCVSGLS